ncbi:hypothetical protein MAR_014014 [Mya arenaria]|uniref:THAP-type domain-containing protein n=1 Tax=Mya arenaria TaxID=6604 RepID=A0ABY7G1K8_MYAAR|nr:hypothetical protein MAR_014014 [Mya arenaria]
MFSQWLLKQNVCVRYTLQLCSKLINGEEFRDVKSCLVFGTTIRDVGIINNDWLASEEKDSSWIESDEPLAVVSPEEPTQPLHTSTPKKPIHTSKTGKGRPVGRLLKLKKTGKCNVYSHVGDDVFIAMYPRARSSGLEKKYRRRISTVRVGKGEVVNELCVTLHRFPTDDKLRKLWIKRVKAVSPNFVSSLKNDRLCSVHFTNGKYTKENPVPCVFIINNKEKIFKLSKVESSEPAYKCNDEDQEAENEEYDGPDCTLTTSSVSEYASIKFHDYAGQIEFPVQKTLNKDTQADNVGVSFSTQTEGTSSVSVTKCSVSTQTDFETPLCKCMSKTTSEVGVQVNKPDLTVEDIKSNEMCMFYTGLPNVETFHLLFDEMDDVGSHTNKCGN